MFDKLLKAKKNSKSRTLRDQSRTNPLKSAFEMAMMKRLETEKLKLAYLNPYEQ
jgi:hypothetical protein